MGTVQLAVSELVTHARKYAPGPCLLTLEVEDGAVQVTVWDSSTTLPLVLPPDPTRIGQHGLEIVMTVCQSFTVRRDPVTSGSVCPSCSRTAPAGTSSPARPCDPVGEVT
ncbi:ATP-binding protein [Streptomyces sp. NPDC051561]|uniref:ATP-binding protein n=1 Tax=Streptomyces sp. NPDC051561 TaxID=3365658 RepID=UPI003796900E